MRKNGVLLLLAVAGSLVVYGNSLGGQFVYDDANFVDRQELRDPAWLLRVWGEPLLPRHYQAGNYRPVYVASWVAGFLVFGESTWWFHVVNIVLHAVVVVLVYLVVRQLGAGWRVAGIAAGLFLVLPIHTEAVAWVKGRDELLYGVWGVGGWWMYLNYLGGRSRVWLGGSVLALALALFSKEMALVLPIAYVAGGGMRYGWRGIGRSWVWLSIAVLIYLSVRSMVLGQYAWGESSDYFVVNPLRVGSVAERVWTPFKIWWIYISKSVWPSGLSATYFYDQVELVRNPLRSREAIAGIVVVIGLLGVTTVYRMWRNVWGVGLMFLGVSYLLISKTLFQSSDIVAERWMYVPSVGIVMMVGAGLARGIEKFGRVGWMVSVGVIVGYGWITMTRNWVWRDNYALARSMVASAPGSMQGYLYLSKVQMERGEVEEAKKNAEIAQRIYARHPLTLAWMGRLAMGERRYGEALEYLREAVRLRPQLPEAHIYVVLSLAKLGKYEECLKEAEKGLAYEPRNSQLRFGKAVCLYKLERYDEAREYYDWVDDLPLSEKLKYLEAF